MDSRALTIAGLVASVTLFAGWLIVISPTIGGIAVGMICLLLGSGVFALSDTVFQETGAILLILGGFAMILIASIARRRER